MQTAANDAYSSHKPSEPNTVPGRLVFSASDSDSTYGRSYGVSVAAAYVLMIIKEYAAATLTEYDCPYMPFEFEA